jgi:DoxX-like family
MSAAMPIALILVATTAGVLTARREEEAPPPAAGSSSRSLIRSIAYWFFTVVVAFELAAGALWDLLRIEYVRVVFAHLGYPLYLLIILGVWRIPGALVLLAPRLPRLKEWAYAGAFFDYSGAVASHYLAGDGVGKWAGPAMFSLVTLVSWALRPASRRLPNPPAPKLHAERWTVPVLIVPVLILAAMLAVAMFTLPKGAPPQ